MERYVAVEWVCCVIKGLFSLVRFLKYVRPNNLVSLLLRFFIAFPSILTLRKQVLAATSITLDPTSGKLHTIATVTDSGVYSSTGVRIWFEIITKERRCH
jgi:hypothetical protein